MIIHGKKTSIEDVQEWAIKLGGKLLSTEYNNMLSKLNWSCSYGHEFSTSFNHVKNRGQWCPMCGRSKALKSIRETMAKDNIRAKISKSHLARLKKEKFYCGLAQRDISKRLRDNLTGLFRNPTKHKRILKYVGCSLDELKAHLESKFLPGMTWDNRGFKGWHIDHVIPLSKFDLTKDCDIYKSFNYNNLQPLWCRDNLTKHNK